MIERIQNRSCGSNNQFSFSVIGNGNRVDDLRTTVTLLFTSWPLLFSDFAMKSLLYWDVSCLINWQIFVKIHMYNFQVRKIKMRIISAATVAIPILGNNIDVKDIQ